MPGRLTSPRTSVGDPDPPWSLTFLVTLTNSYFHQHKNTEVKFDNVINYYQSYEQKAGLTLVLRSLAAFLSRLFFLVPWR